MYQNLELIETIYGVRLSDPNSFKYRLHDSEFKVVFIVKARTRPCIVTEIVKIYKERNKNAAAAVLAYYMQTYRGAKLDWMSSLIDADAGLIYDIYPQYERCHNCIQKKILILRWIKPSKAQ